MIRIEKWSQEALSNRGKYMYYDLDFIDDEGRVAADFLPSYIELEPDEDNETRFITAYGTYRFGIDKEEVFGKLEVELSEYVEVDETKTIDYYLNKNWDNFVVYDPDVLEFLEKIKS